MGTGKATPVTGGNSTSSVWWWRCGDVLRLQGNHLRRSSRRWNSPSADTDVNRKLLIVVLVVIVMVFVVTLALGAGRPTGSSSDDTGPVEFLKGLRSGSYLQIGGDVAAPACSNVTSNSVTVIGMSSCTIEVAGRGFFSRPTQVALEPNGQLSVTVHPEEGPSLEGDLAGRRMLRHLDRSARRRHPAQRPRSGGCGNASGRKLPSRVT